MSVEFAMCPMSETFEMSKTVNAVKTVDDLRESFEAWFSRKYDWQIRRGSYGRQTAHLKRFEGEYISDIARNDFEVWCAAHGL